MTDSVKHCMVDVTIQNFEMTSREQTFLFNVLDHHPITLDLRSRIFQLFRAEYSVHQFPAIDSPQDRKHDIL